MKKLMLLMLLVTLSVSAQKKETDPVLPEANAQFAEKNYIEAEANYRISQSRNPKKAIAPYNLGNTIYRIDQTSEARNAYLTAIENAKSRSEKHRAYHNLGNVFMKEKNYLSAVEAYKQALINNPSDEQTRYNYALAKKFLKDNPPKNDDKKDKNKDDKSKKPQDAKDNKEDKNSKDKDSQNNKNQEQKKDNNGDQPKPRPRDAMSKQRVENLLDAVSNEERKVQDKVNKRKVKAKPVRNEKDW